MYIILPEKDTIGIYKITNPKGRVYIGQSMCIRSRWNLYKNYHCKTQPMLYRSLNKHGLENHTFEILTTCSECELNDLERYYQDVYNVLDRKCGLNLRLTVSSDRSGRMSEEHKKNLSNALKNSEKFREARKRDAQKRKGIPLLEETKEKLSKARKGLHSGSKNPAARQIVVKNLNTLEVFEGSMECVAKHIGCDVEYVWNQVDELTKTANRYKEWIFMDKNKHHDFLDIKGDVYLDLYTGIYHFYDEYMDIPRKRWKSDSVKNRLKNNRRYIIV